MADAVYVDGNGVLRHRQYLGDGSQGDPHRFGFFSTSIEAAIASTNTKLDTLAALQGGAEFGSGTHAAATNGPSIFLGVQNYRRFTMEIANQGGTALSEFNIYARINGSGNYQLLYSSEADYSNPDPRGILVSVKNINGDYESPLVFRTAGAAVGRIYLAFNFSEYFVERLRIQTRTSSGTASMPYFWGASN